MDYRLLSISFFALVTGCAGRGGTGADDARLSRAMASLMETSEMCAHQGRDSAGARAAADSALAVAGMSREEFLGALRGLEREPGRWRAVSEDAAKLLEQRLASRAGTP